MISLIEEKDVVKIGRNIVEERICCLCKGNDTYIAPDGKYDWRHCTCNKIDCTEYLCKDCWNKYYYYNIAKYDHESRDFILNAQFRTGKLSRYSTNGIGFVGAQIVAKTLGVDDCNIKMDNFCFYVDLSKHDIYGIGEVKTATLNKINGCWKFTIENEYFIFNTMFLVCMDENEPWKNVERIYAIPKKEIIQHGIGITIVKNPLRCTWYDDTKKKYRIDEKPFDEIYHKMKLKNCTVLNKEE